MTKHELPKAYDFKATESRIYAMWEAGGFFQPHNDPNKPGFDPNVEPFVITIPPPNVTGELHLGHAMFVSVEDLMIRGSTFDVYQGNMALDVETSKSFTAGLVWSQFENFDLAVDYYKIEISNQVQSQDRERLRATEADCRLGVTDTGESVDINSPTCVDALARVIREDPADPLSAITSVHFTPINIAREETSGIDVTANYRLETAEAGNFAFCGNYTFAHKHTRQQYPGDPVEDMLDVSFAATTLPRVKSNLGVNWDKDAWGASLFGNYLGRVANYSNDAWTQPTWRFNAGTRYDVNDHLRLSLSVNNLLDKMRPKDATWANYPYYDTSWFDSVGRSYFLTVTWKMDGTPLE